MLHDWTWVGRLLQALLHVFALGRLAEGMGAGCSPCLGWLLSTVGLSGLICAPKAIGSKQPFQDFNRERGSKASAP